MRNSLPLSIYCLIFFDWSSYLGLLFSAATLIFIFCFVRHLQVNPVYTHTHTVLYVFICKSEGNSSFRNTILTSNISDMCLKHSFMLCGSLFTLTALYSVLFSLLGCCEVEFSTETDASLWRRYMEMRLLTCLPEQSILISLTYCWSHKARQVKWRI